MQRKGNLLAALSLMPLMVLAGECCRDRDRHAPGAQRRRAPAAAGGRAQRDLHPAGPYRERAADACGFRGAPDDGPLLLSGGAYLRSSDVASLNGDDSDFEPCEAAPEFVCGGEDDDQQGPIPASSARVSISRPAGIPARTPAEFQEYWARRGTTATSSSTRAPSSLDWTRRVLRCRRAASSQARSRRCVQTFRTHRSTRFSTCR